MAAAPAQGTPRVGRAACDEGAVVTRPRLLDLFCGAGGAAMGYHRAGFDVVGVDINPQPNYPFEFHRGDALAYLAEHGRGFDAIHASPPCQAFTLAAAGGVRKSAGHPELIEPVRALLRNIGAPYAIENVPQAPLVDPVTLCGTSFGLPIIRHRSFECSTFFMAPTCGYRPTARVSHGGTTTYPYARKSWGPAWRKHVLPVVWPWMTVRESGQAIPPAYTEFIGRQLLDHIREAAA